MKSRKCDTDKYRRRRKKEKKNRVVKETFPGGSQVGAATHATEAVTCPLCNIAFDVESWMENRKVITLNRKPVHVHKVCPTEGK